jgi:UDP-glucose 4-epimerase
MQRDNLYGEVFNIGSHEEITIAELAQRVRNATGSDSEIRRVPYDEAYEHGFEDMARRVPDITKIRRLLGWAPSRSLEEILSDVIAEHSRDGEGVTTASQLSHTGTSLPSV